MKNLLLNLKLLFFRMRDSMAIRYSVGGLVMSHFVCVGVYKFSAFWTSLIAILCMVVFMYMCTSSVTKIACSGTLVFPTFG